MIGDVEAETSKHMATEFSYIPQCTVVTNVHPTPWPEYRIRHHAELANVQHGIVTNWLIQLAASTFAFPGEEDHLHAMTILAQSAERKQQLRGGNPPSTMPNMQMHGPTIQRSQSEDVFNNTSSQSPSIGVEASRHRSPRPPSSVPSDGMRIPHSRPSSAGPSSSLVGTVGERSCAEARRRSRPKDRCLLRRRSHSPGDKPVPSSGD